jgi:hypothetical protein
MLLYFYIPYQVSFYLLKLVLKLPAREMDNRDEEELKRYNVARNGGGIVNKRELHLLLGTYLRETTLP